MMPPNLLLLTLMALSTTSDAGWSQWTHQAEVSGLAGEAGFVRITLSSPVLARANRDLSDLRLVDETGIERPYVVTGLQRRFEEHFEVSRILDQGIVPGEYQQIVCDLGEGERVSNEIQIETSAPDFHRRVQVSGSADREDWLILRERAYIFVHQQPAAAALSISFPDTTYRFLRIVIWLEDEPQLPISAIRVGSVRHREVPVESQVAQIVSVEHDSERQTSDLMLQLPLENQHFIRARLQVQDEAFRRWAAVAYQDEQRRWIESGASSIYRIPVSQRVEEQLSIPLANLHPSRARLRIWNEDNPPLVVESVRFEREPRILVFRSQPRQRYRILVGNDVATTPRYDLHATVGRLDAHQLAEATLEPLRPNPGFRPILEQLPWSERYPALLWIGLGTGVLLLLWLLRRTLLDLKEE